jgi:hypothetical protein
MTPEYSGTPVRPEKANGELTVGQKERIGGRNEPFTVFMVWMRVLVMSTGIDTAVARKPDAKLWSSHQTRPK